MCASLRGLGTYRVDARGEQGETFDHSRGPWYKRLVQEIAISKFKATCLAVLEEVRRTGTPVLVTRFGKPMAEILPPPKPAVHSWLGCMEGSAEILGDIVGPIGAFDGWTVDEK